MGSAAPSNDPLGVGLDVGQRAPDFSIRLLDGSTVTLSSLRGRPVWLNFWASSCDACVTEMPFIERLYEERRGSGLAVVGISVESPAPDAVGLARALGVTYTLGFDRDGSITRLYRVALLPAQFWIDRAGVIRDWALGEVPPEVMAADVAKIVGR